MKTFQGQGLAVPVDLHFRKALLCCNANERRCISSDNDLMLMQACQVIKLLCGSQAIHLFLEEVDDENLTAEAMEEAR